MFVVSVVVVACAVGGGGAAVATRAFGCVCVCRSTGIMRGGLGGGGAVKLRHSQRQPLAGVSVRMDAFGRRFGAGVQCGGAS